MDLTWSKDGDRPVATIRYRADRGRTRRRAGAGPHPRRPDPALRAGPTAPRPPSPGPAEPAGPSAQLPEAEPPGLDPRPAPRRLTRARRTPPNSTGPGRRAGPGPSAPGHDLARPLVPTADRPPPARDLPLIIEVDSTMVGKRPAGRSIPATAGRRSPRSAAPGRPRPGSPSESRPSDAPGSRSGRFARVLAHSVIPPPGGFRSQEISPPSGRRGRTG